MSYEIPITLSDLQEKKQVSLIPKRVTIETIFGCNASCIMCPIDHPTKRKKGTMKMDLYKNIIDSLVPYKAHIEMMDLFGLGEPLLDPHIFERVRYVKERGFKNIGFSTNADLLNVEKQKLLLESGIDTVIFSIDGIKKETHEYIRRNVDFDRVVANCESIIRMRNEEDYKTRFLIRFIRQESNRDQWEPFKQFWQCRISEERRDFISAYNVHTWGGEVATKDGILKEDFRDPTIEKQACYQIFNIIYILADGSVPVCSEDWLHAKSSIGNVANLSPIEIYNGDKFNKMREIHLAGNKNMIPKCQECTLLYSVAAREVAGEQRVNGDNLNTDTPSSGQMKPATAQDTPNKQSVPIMLLG